jgi:hypothetical protein
MRNSKNHLKNIASVRRMRIAISGIACALAVCVLPATALGASDTASFTVQAGTLSLTSAPDYPNFGALTLNGQSQTLSAQMGNFTVADGSGSGAGWNVTVIGDSGGGKSPVFKVYCPNANCGPDTGPGYVSGGATLPANSLTLTSTGAGFSALNGTTGTAPTHSCGSGCFVDSASAVKLISAATNAGMGTYQASGYGASSLALVTPTTVKALQTNERYQVDLVTTLNSGP